MVLVLSKKTLLALLPYFIRAAATVSGSASGSGTTTRYWDCCKTSCAWSGKMDLASGATPVQTCNIDDSPLNDPNATSGCDGGDAYMCSDNSPWAVSEDLAYGYAAVSIAGGTESSWCCACYELTFTSTAIAGKKMIVQATNTGSDLSTNQFDLTIPGGGVGIFNGCTAEWGAPSSGWGAQYGGISSATACATFPTALQPGCEWRYDWFQGANNPTVDFVQVECPAALTAKTGCVRSGENPTGPSSVSIYLGGGSATSIATSSAAASSSSASPTSSTAPVIATTTPTVSSSSSISSVVPQSETTAAPSSSTSSLILQSETQPTLATSSAIETASPSDAGISSSSPIETSIPSVATSQVRVPQVSSSAPASTLVTSSIQPTATTSAPSKTMQTSLIIVTVTAKPGDVIGSSGGEDYCEL